MAILVIGGSGKDIGKTGLVCAVISALREFDWTAVKITGHDYRLTQKQPGITHPLIREETHAGKETDTARYLAAGARNALLVTRTGPRVPIDIKRQVVDASRNVIFESNRIIDALNPDVCVALIGDGERKPSFERLMRVADAIITLKGSSPGSLPNGIRRFDLQSVDPLPSDFVSWLKQRLAQSVS